VSRCAGMAVTTGRRCRAYPSVIDSARLARAIWLEGKLIDVDTYRVRGGAADHMVEVVGGRCYCDCIDAQVRGDGCKHSLLVRLLAGDKEVVRALRALVPAPTGRSAERATKLSHPESPNSRGTSRDAPDSPKTAHHVGSGATNVDPRGVQYQ